ncbi:MAG: hypothetical protein BWK76_19540 [Desulfobulbaceae bacterium A2]|nr:MAG: hypothetical protein BWK76_19540 [Desulfobulbaceae bacterium A2]
MIHGNRLIPLLMALIFLAGCGQTVEETLHVPSGAPPGGAPGADRTVVILPFADYSAGDTFESAYRRSLVVTENITDGLVRQGFRLPVQEDVFHYLVEQEIIRIGPYDEQHSPTLRDALAGDWSASMKVELRQYMNQVQMSRHTTVLDSPGTHGFNPQTLAKIGRKFNADYIVRGRILQYKGREENTWEPWKRGALPFVIGGSNKLLFGTASTEEYDMWNNQVVGGTFGAIYGYHDATWPYKPGKADQTILGISGAQDANTIIWGALGSTLGEMAHNSGRVPQAVVQLRIWVQDAHSGNVVWTNRVDVKVSPETMLADQQFDALFEKATEKAVATLINDFANRLH